MYYNKIFDCLFGHNQDFSPYAKLNKYELDNAFLNNTKFYLNLN